MIGVRREQQVADTFRRDPPTPQLRARGAGGGARRVRAGQHAVPHGSAPALRHRRYEGRDSGVGRQFIRVRERLVERRVGRQLHCPPERVEPNGRRWRRGEGGGGCRGERDNGGRTSKRSGGGGGKKHPPPPRAGPPPPPPPPAAQRPPPPPPAPARAPRAPRPALRAG